MLRGVRHLTIDEFVRFIYALTGPNKTRNRALAFTQACTGYRIMEVLSLRIGDVWEHGRIKDRIYVPKRFMKKKIQTRTVITTDLCKKALSSWIREIRRNGDFNVKAPLFHYTTQIPIIYPPIGVRFQPITVWRRIMVPIGRYTALKIYKKTALKANIPGPIGSHSLRKLFAVEAHDIGGRDISVTAEVIGHKDIRATRHYVPTEQEAADKIVAEVSRRLERAFL